MPEKSLEAQREYYRKWRAANPDKKREYNRRYWAKKAAQKEKGEESGDNTATAE